MFAVHFLAKRVMIDRLLKDGVIRPSRQAGETPRIVIIASESHRSAQAIDFDRFGAYTEYGITESMRHYAPQQACPLHVRDRAIPPPEPDREDRCRCARDVPGRRRFEHCQRRARTSATDRQCGTAAILPVPGGGDRTGLIPVLCGGSERLYGDVPALDASEAGFAGCIGPGKRSQVVERQRAPGVEIPRIRMIRPGQDRPILEAASPS